jgi:hypothetical protein
MIQYSKIKIQPPNPPPYYAFGYEWRRGGLKQKSLINKTIQKFKDLDKVGWNFRTLLSLLHREPTARLQDRMTARPQQQNNHNTNTFRQ